MSTVQGKLSSVGKSMQTTGKNMTLGLTAPIVAIGAKSVSMAADFDKSMRTMSAVAGVPGPQLEKLRKLALKMGQDTVFSAGEAAEAQLELAKAGVSTADIMGGALKNTLDLATAGDLNLADAAQIASNAMNTFNIKGSDSPTGCRRVCRSSQCVERRRKRSRYGPNTGW